MNGVMIVICTYIHIYIYQSLVQYKHCMRGSRYFTTIHVHSTFVICLFYFNKIHYIDNANNTQYQINNYREA